MANPPPTTMFMCAHGRYKRSNTGLCKHSDHVFLPFCPLNQNLACVNARGYLSSKTISLSAFFRVIELGQRGKHALTGPLRR